MKILPILNFNFGEVDVLSQEEIDLLYKLAVENCIDKFGQVELSLSSDRAYESFNVILQAVKDKGGEISFGSVNALEQLHFLKKLLAENNVLLSEAKDLECMDGDSSPSAQNDVSSAQNDDGSAQNDGNTNKIKIFSPAYYKELDEAVKESEGFEYIPGAYDSDDLAELNGFSSVKLFPFAINESYTLRKALIAPYPELTKSIYQSKILEFNTSNFKSYGIEDKVYEEDGLKKIASRNPDQEVVLIRKPSDFQKIRSRFLFDPKLKIAFITDLKQSAQELMEPLGSKRLYLTGLGAFDSVVQGDNVVLATRVFNNIVLDLLSGSLKVHQLDELMKEELEIKAGCREIASASPRNDSVASPRNDSVASPRNDSIASPRNDYSSFTRNDSNKYE